jgi:hypothetical protein
MFVAVLGCWICYSGLSRLQSGVSYVPKPIDVMNFVRPAVASVPFHVLVPLYRMILNQHLL